jgi:RNA polymerase sigma-70 factor (ECF subfamily)
VEKREEFQKLLQEIQGGSDEAVQELLEVYGKAILFVIRTRLHRRLRSKFDSTDFLQDVWASFYRSPPPAAAFGGPEALVRYLTMLARNKVVDAVRRRAADPTHDVRHKGRRDPLATASAREPTPSQVFVAKEQWERATRGRTKLQVTILKMLRDGHSHPEIAEALGLSEKMVQRLVRKVSEGLCS